MRLFLAILIGLPLIEIYFLIKVGAVIGALPTIGLAILTAILGIALVRRQGFSILLRVREMLDRGEVPAREMMDGALLLIAGFMLLLPGFLTDSIGFLLLLPPLRRWVISRYLGQIPITHDLAAGRGQPPRIIDGEYRRDD